MTSARYSVLKGVSDILPKDGVVWDFIEETARAVFSVFGFKHIRTPIIEHTELFARGIGEATDIVEKEMYTFKDRGERMVTLRPEGTASVVRSYIENRLYDLAAPQKFYYLGPMFRYERPQKGRYRQFYQLGAEIFGEASPVVDAEMFSMLAMFIDRVGLKDTTLELNSIGCKSCRPPYKEKLVAYFDRHKDSLCNDCKDRLTKNPMRILDCKVGGCIAIKTGAPTIKEFYCKGCREHHDGLVSMLRDMGIDYNENPFLVRGLDYYTKTAFEITARHLGAQNTVIAGGRYDDLVAELGGPATPAIGFAIGMERLALLLTGADTNRPNIYFAVLGHEANRLIMTLTNKFRKDGLYVESGVYTHPLKTQMKRADKMGAAFAVIIGDDEIAKEKAVYRRLSDGSQGEIGFDELGNLLTMK